MILLRGIPFFCVLLLMLAFSDIIAMNNAEQSREGCLGILPDCVKKVKKFAAPKKPWLCSDAVFTPRYRIVAIASHPNKDIVVTASDEVVDIWNMDVERQKSFHNCWSIRTRDIAVHPKKDLIADLALNEDTGYGYDALDVTIWDPHTGVTLQSFRCWNTKFWEIQFHPQEDLIALRQNYKSPIQHVWNINSGEKLSTPVDNWPNDRIVHPDVKQKGDDVHVIKEYKDYALDQLQLKYALSHWLLIEKPDKKINSLEKLFSDVAWKCGLDYQQCCVTWESFPKPMQWAWLKDILSAIQRHGK